MKRLTITIILFCALFLYNTVTIAQEAAQVKSEDKYDYLAGLTYIDTITQPVKRALRENKIDLNFFAGILQGYDNNVNLDPDRKKDGFLQTSLDTELTYNYTDDIRLKVENDTSDIAYYNTHSANMLDIYNKAGLELDLYRDMFTVGTDYALDLVIFPIDIDGTYLGNQVRAYLKHNITSWFYQKIMYKFLNKNFTRGRTKKADGEQGGYRKDYRNGMDYEVGTYISDKAVLRAGIEFYYNKSNYKYFNYYDFWSFKVTPSCIFLITDKLSVSGSFSYQQRLYDARLSSETDAHVYDDTYTVNASVLYDLTKSFTLVLNYLYRENSSNEPLQKYSGSIITGGVYYSF